MRKTLTAALGGMIVVGFLGTPAHASLARAWISGKGTDNASCGPITAPCRSLQYTHDNVIAAGGEIDVLDSAGYGSLSNTKSLTVISNGSLAGVLATSGNNAITIAAGATDKIFLRGLTIEGANAGQNGIAFTTGASLVVDRCVIQAFVQNGIFINPPVGTNPSVIITRTTANNNGNVGVYVFPVTSLTGIASVNAAIDGGAFSNNGDGVALDVGGSNSLTGRRFVSVSNTTAANNAHNGVRLNEQNSFSNSTLFVDAYRATGNGNSGLEHNGGGGDMYFGRSLSTENDYGFSHITKFGNVYTYADNKIGGNRSGDFVSFGGFNQYATKPLR